MNKHLSVLPLLLAGFILISCVSTRNDLSISLSDYQTITETEKAEHFTYKTEYPLFSENEVLNEAIKEQIVNPVKKTSRDTKEDWKLEAEERKTAFGDTSFPPYESLTTLESVVESENFISIVFHDYTYTGGAHGYPCKKTLTYMKSEDRIVNIMKATGLSLDKISRLCYDELLTLMDKEQISDIQWIQEGTEPETENYRAFTFDGRTLTVFFNPYQVAPYASGIIKIEVEL